MLLYFAKTLGIAGLLLITYGIYAGNEKKQDYIFALGGVFLLAYSSYLRDPIFIVLQIVFTTSSLFEIYKINKRERSLPISVSTDEVANLLTKK